MDEETRALVLGLMVGFIALVSIRVLSAMFGDIINVIALVGAVSGLIGLYVGSRWGGR